MCTLNKAGVLKRIHEEHYNLNYEKIIFTSNTVHSGQSFFGHICMLRFQKRYENGHFTSARLTRTCLREKQYITFDQFNPKAKQSLRGKNANFVLYFSLHVYRHQDLTSLLLKIICTRYFTSIMSTFL